MSPRRSRAFGAALAAGLGASAIAGCVSLLPDAGPAPDTFRLSLAAPASVAADPAPDAWILEIPAPTAPRALNTDRIAISDGVTVAYVSGARWEAPAPRLLQRALIARFDAAPQVAAAVHPADGVRAPYELRLDIQAFEAAYDAGPSAAPNVTVRMAAKLIDERSRALIAARVFAVTRRADENGVGAIVRAMDAGVADVADELVVWTSAAVDARAKAQDEADAQAEAESETPEPAE